MSSSDIEMQGGRKKHSSSNSYVNKRRNNNNNSSPDLPQYINTSNRSAVLELSEDDDLLLPNKNDYSDPSQFLAAAYPSLWLILTTALWSAAVYTFLLSPIVNGIMGIQPGGVSSSSMAIASSSAAHSEYDQALKESYGFFSDIPTHDWRLMKERVQNRRNHWDMNNPTIYMENPPAWYQNNFEPDFTCPHERRVGGMGDGPKWVCDPHRIPPYSQRRQKNGGNGCLVYSVGSQGNFEFEIGLMETLGRNKQALSGGNVGGYDQSGDDAPCEIHVFDPADYSGEAPNGIFYHAWGIKSSTERNMESNFKSFQDTVAALGHEGRVIDVFKIDCEGCEWETFNDWFDSKVAIMQILVEVHKSPPEAIDFFETMQENGYVTFHKEPNTAFGGGTCQEYAMVKLGPKFFEE